MSRKGGYKIIDLKGLDFSSSKVIDGIHESIEDNYGKPLLFSGIVIDDVEKDDVLANVEVNGDGYDVALYDETLHISNDDVVSIKEYELKTITNSDEFYVYKNGNYVVDVPTQVQEVVISSNVPIIVANGFRKSLAVELTNSFTSDGFGVVISDYEGKLILVKTNFALFITCEEEA